MEKSFFYSLFACFFFLAIFFSLYIYSTFPKKIEAASLGSSYSGKKFSGGKITKSPSTEIDKARTSCEGGETCHGTCTNTWSDLSDTSCQKGTFSLNVYGPKSAAKEYCVPNSAKGNGKVSSGKYVLDTYDTSSIKLGICTCTGGAYCAVTTVKTVNVDMANVSRYSTSK